MAGSGAAVGTRSRGHGATRPRGLALVGVSGGRGRKPGLCSGSRGGGVGNPASAPRPWGSSRSRGSPRLRGRRSRGWRASGCLRPRGSPRLWGGGSAVGGRLCASASGAAAAAAAAGLRLQDLPGAELWPWPRQKKKTKNFQTKTKRGIRTSPNLTLIRLRN
jgi:hypothetical protein